MVVVNDGNCAVGRPNTVRAWARALILARPADLDLSVSAATLSFLPSIQAVLSFPERVHKYKKGGTSSVLQCVETSRSVGDKL